jgi:hypothetical protein
MSYIFIVNLFGYTNIDIIFFINLVKLKIRWLIKIQYAYLFLDGGSNYYVPFVNLVIYMTD